MDDDPCQSNDIPHRTAQSIFDRVHAGSIHTGNITQIINLAQVSSKPTAQQPIIVSIHGIRTTGAWQKSITPILTEAGFVHYPYDYGFLFALKMLVPWIRSRMVVAFREFYESVHEKACGAPISLIAHSFGTYIAAKTMANYAQVSFDQIIFCGSIVQREYDWASIIARGQARRVLHDYGSKDLWVRLAEWVITDAGPSGQAGFIDPPRNHVFEQAHPNFRHSDHFYPSNFKQRWVPFLRGEALAMIQPVRPPRLNWKPWLLGLGVLVFLCLSIVLKIPKVVDDNIYQWIRGRTESIQSIDKEEKSATDPTDRRAAHESPIEKLSELGWTVKPSSQKMEFEIASRSIPDMAASVRYFRQLRVPFRLRFQSVQNIVGLRFISDVSNCQEVIISAGEFTDISDLGALIGLKSLSLSQIPLSGLSTIDIASLAHLHNLQELNLADSKVTDLIPIENLTQLRVLNLYNTPVRDLAPLSRLTLIESLDVSGTEVTDLSPLGDMTNLRELHVGGKQLHDLGKLSHIASLAHLQIVEQTQIDLTAVGALTNLKSLVILARPRINLATLGDLKKLEQLTIRGLGFESLSSVTDVDVIGSLRGLVTLSLGAVNIRDVAFISQLTNLRELNLGLMPLASIEPLRGLSSLSNVSLNSLPVVDISPLLGLSKLSKVSVTHTPARADVLTELERRGVKIQR